LPIVVSTSCSLEVNLIFGLLLVNGIMIEF
jgi:hypothetical protein